MLGFIFERSLDTIDPRGVGRTWVRVNGSLLALASLCPAIFGRALFLQSTKGLREIGL